MSRAGVTSTKSPRERPRWARGWALLVWQSRACPTSKHVGCLAAVCSYRTAYVATTRVIKRCRPLPNGEETTLAGSSPHYLPTTCAARNGIRRLRYIWNRGGREGRERKRRLWKWQVWRLNTWNAPLHSSAVAGRWPRFPPSRKEVGWCGGPQIITGKREFHRNIHIDIEQRWVPLAFRSEKGWFSGWKGMVTRRWQSSTTSSNQSLSRRNKISFSFLII